MSKSPLVRLAKRWVPEEHDPFGPDKLALIQFLLEQNVTSANPMPIKQVLKEAPFMRSFTREAFQHKLLGPLRRDPRVFVGTSGKGIFLVVAPEDADQTLGFYTWRVRAELRHARNLRALAKRVKLFEGYESKPNPKKERAVIYIDESGTPDVSDADQRFFVVAAVIVESQRVVASLQQRFKNACAIINRPPEQELKAKALSVRKHTLVLRELSLIEYQWAAACFDKSHLESVGLADPTTFYRFAFQFLVSDLLTVAWQADLVIDEHSTAEFQAQLRAYLRRQNSGMPIHRLQEIKFAQSNKDRLVQLADLVAGAVRRYGEGDRAPLREIEPLMISLQFWPPR